MHAYLNKSRSIHGAAVPVVHTEVKIAHYCNMLIVMVQSPGMLSGRLADKRSKCALEQKGSGLSIAGLEQGSGGGAGTGREGLHWMYGLDGQS